MSQSSNYVEQIFEWVRSHSGLFSTLLSVAVWATLVRQVLKYYAAPRVSYWGPKRDGTSTFHIIVKSYEPMQLDEPYTFKLQSLSGLSKVKVCAGPWFKAFEPERPSLPPAPVYSLLIHLHGIPIEGVIAMQVTTIDGLTPDISIVKGEARDFRTIPRWAHVRVINLMSRSFLGALTSLSIFGVLMTLSQREIGVEFVLAAIGISSVVAPCVYLLTVPFAGKELIQGYTGWSDTGQEWMAPPSPTQEQREAAFADVESTVSWWRSRPHS
ncbi:hypothetical protein ACLESO_01190 [Pyxidicoccus sp. 3LG]